MNNLVVVGLGSNIFPDENIALAKKVLAKKFIILTESNFIQTKPIGYIDQPEFINGAILLETELSQELLKSNLKSIESDMGREVQENKFRPRVIDLDIIIWNNIIVDEDFYQRDYLKKSVLELLPNINYRK